jgi:hypothetical protein
MLHPQREVRAQQLFEFFVEAVGILGPQFGGFHHGES